MAKPPSRQQKPSRNIRNPARNLPAIISPDTRAGLQTMASNPSAEEPKKKRNWVQDPGMFLISVATVIIVGVYTFYARQQVIETQTANAIAKKALTEASRPYVMMENIFGSNSKDANGIHPHVGFKVTNFGNTPATYVKFTNCDPIIRNDNAVPNFKCNVSEQPTSEWVLGPKQSVYYVGSVFAQSDIDLTKDAEKFIYILGYVTYQDDIDVDYSGVPEQRITRFCQRIEKVLRPPAPNAPEGTASAPISESPPASAIHQSLLVGMPCPAFNCIDKGCLPL
ncbi:MAG: hypothetical protein WBD78_05845 [Methylocella sp.]